jgi:hypothetical protein
VDEAGDAAAEVLLAAGLVPEAAFPLGWAEATEFPVSTIFPREPRLDAARAEIAGRLCRDETDRLLAEGAAASIDEALARIRGWLRSR